MRPCTHVAPPFLAVIAVPSLRLRAPTFDSQAPRAAFGGNMKQKARRARGKAELRALPRLFQNPCQAIRKDQSVRVIWAPDTLTSLCSALEQGLGLL